MNQLQILDFRGNQVRMVLINGEPWWVAKDVCEALGIANYRDAVARLDDDEKDAVGITDAIGRTQETAIINEPGLYRIILGARMKRDGSTESEERNARVAAFKRWVTHEVIPAIRRDGMYVTPELLFNPEHLLRVTQRLVEEHRARLAAEAKVAELTPKAEFHDRVASSEDGLSIADVAKTLGTGEIRLFRWLRENGILLSTRHEWNLPRQEYLDRGYFKLQKQTWTDKAGQEHISTKTLVTGKGLIWLQQQWDADRQASLAGEERSQLRLVK